jgi:hypothetical protein
MRLRIAKIHEAAVSRPPDYVQTVLSRGVVDGERLEISDQALAELRQQFRPTPPPVPEMAASLARAAADEAKAIFFGSPGGSTRVHCRTHGNLPSMRAFHPWPEPVRAVRMLCRPQGQNAVPALPCGEMVSAVDSGLGA